MKIYILAFLLSIGFSVLFGFILIPILKKFKIGQNVLCYVTEHKNKSGTPTMGGLFFVLSTVITYLIFSKGEKFLSSIALLISVSFLIVGFLDDFIKIKFKRNLGLTPLQKTVFMVAISIIASLFAFRNGFNFVFLPFVNKTLYLGVFSIILNVFVFLATVNGANLLDGLDGL
ncbi:MAG: phospho-N-acetylmuramoyl-pentapeptide-transferase, partial [Clostridia bacterium]|nr:phospho-N-acetylmuramoyl-pentapeptide-transferase [Clostridia bacterium]